MSTQSDYDNAVQTCTAQARRTLFAIAPVEAWNDRQKFDAAEQAVRSSILLADELDNINELWLGRVEEEIGALGEEAWDLIRAAYRRVQMEVVAPAIRARAIELEAGLPHVEPYAAEHLNAQSQGITSAHGGW